MPFWSDSSGQARLIHVNDPRLSAVFKHTSPCMGVQMRPDQVQHVPESNPWQWAEMLYKQFTPLIKLMSSRAQVEREVKHELKMQEKLRKLKVRLLVLAKKHPGAVVLRLELYAPCLAHVEHGAARVHMRRTVTRIIADERAAQAPTEVKEAA